MRTGEVINRDNFKNVKSVKQIIHIEATYSMQIGRTDKIIIVKLQLVDLLRKYSKDTNECGYNMLIHLQYSNR